MGNRPEIRVVYEGRAELEEQLKNSLSAGGAFARGAIETQANTECTAVLVHPATGAELPLPALVVLIAGDGVGLAFQGFDNAMADRITKFVAQQPEAKPASRPAQKIRGNASDVNQRIRNLPVAEQTKLARTGDQVERVALERIYGKLVWEALLRNPRITQPEIARIARKGVVPRILIERICENQTWIRSPQVRRALLSNPKLTREFAEKVLRITPKPELKLIPKQTAYPAIVREIAARILR